MNIEMILHSKFNCAKSFAHAVNSLIEQNKKCRSGLIGVDNSLSVVSCKLFNDELNNIPLHGVIENMRLAKNNGIVAFDITEIENFVLRPTLINKLNLACEASHVDLVDVMFIHADDWMSLRQHNRL